ncbi:unnamed protein product, partial [Tetraodon nigroviridis]
MRQYKVLNAWTGRFNIDLLKSRCRLAYYHVTSSFLQPENRSIGPSVKKRQRRVFEHEGSVQIPGFNQKKKNGSKVSLELRKLSLEDSPREKWQQLRQKTKVDSRSDSHEIVFGIAPCLLALSQGRRKAFKLFVKDGEAAERASVLKVCEEAHSRGVQICHVRKNDLDKMSLGRVHQGVCLQASRLDFLTKTTCNSRGSKDSNRPPLWLVLEEIQDPMNLGAILRSAYFLGVDRVASSVHRSCPLSPVVSKASSGVMEVMEVYGYESLEDMLRMKVAQGWQVVGSVGTEAEATHIPIIRCSDFHLTKPTLLLMGGEGEGLSRGLLSLCQALLSIPAGRNLFPGIESLNVSVAAGIILHSMLQSRK